MNRPLPEAKPAVRMTEGPQRRISARLLEFLVLLILILIFVTISIGRIWELRISAERVNIEQLIGVLKRTLGSQLASSVARRGYPLELGRYQHSNPMALLMVAPKNYLGEFDTTPEEPVPGAWYFNRQEGTLNYRVRFGDDFVGSNPDDPNLIRFQIQLDYDDRNGNGRYEPAIDTPRSLTLVSLDDYRWTAGAGQE
jgi:hypothetical protein